MHLNTCELVHMLPSPLRGRGRSPQATGVRGVFVLAMLIYSLATLGFCSTAGWESCVNDADCEAVYGYCGCECVNKTKIDQAESHFVPMRATVQDCFEIECSSKDVIARCVVNKCLCISKRPPKEFQINIPAAHQGERLGQDYTCTGKGVSPPLRWHPLPNHKSFALVMEDLDSDSQPRIHWLVYNIPAGFSELPVAMSANAADRSIMQGRNDFGEIGYHAPCSKYGIHRYRITFYALDEILPIGPGADIEHLQAAIEGHRVSESDLIILSGGR